MMGGNQAVYRRPDNYEQVADRPIYSQPERKPA